MQCTFVNNCVAPISCETHVAVRAHGWTCSEIIGPVHRITGVAAEDRRRNERRETQDALLQLIKQRLLTWK